MSYQSAYIVGNKLLIILHIFDSLFYLYADLLEKKPKRSDLFRLFQNSSSHYMIIGTALDVKVDDLLSFQADNNLIQVFQRWIDSNNDVTWRKILQVCKDYPDKLGNAKANVEEFLSSDRARDEYY